MAFAAAIVHAFSTCVYAFCERVGVCSARQTRLTSAWTRWRSTCRARFARTWEAQTDKNAQNNYIDLPTTTTQHSSARHTLRAAVVASQQILQAPSSPESTSINRGPRALPPGSPFRQPQPERLQQELLAPRRQQRPRLPPPRPPISIVDSLMLRPES